MSFDGLNTHLGSLALLSSAQTRSISPENRTGEKGKGGMAMEGTGARCARDLGPGWKISPSLPIPPGETLEMAAIEGPGTIQQVWMAGTAIVGHTRTSILRIYWDEEETPSVECPVGDFFACGWGRFPRLSSLAVCVNPGSGLNCYWPMPFRQHCRITLENRAPEEVVLYYQVNYCLAAVPEGAACFHAQFRRTNPLPYKEPYTILDGVRGQGQYVGTYMAWGVNNSGWWGEGEIKFYLDGDREYPTICGTGTEDYFCGAYNFENRETKEYQEFSTPYAGLHEVIRPDGVYQSQQRFGMYRWHIMDPVRFQKDLRVTIQALGWRSGGRYLPLQDDIASVAFWYQTEPHGQFPALGDRDQFEVI